MTHSAQRQIYLMSPPSRRPKKSKESEVKKCLGCLVQREPCVYGTHKTGSCGTCGNLKLIDCPPFWGFFNEALGFHMLDMMRTSYALLTSDENVVEITIRTTNSSSDLHLRLMESELLPSNADSLKTYFDQTVWQSCILNIGCKMATTSLIRSALYGRVYLMFLSPCHIMEGEGSISNWKQLINFVLTRLSESISEVVDGLKKGHAQDDKRYWSEAAIALAILCYGLHHTQEILEEPAVQPVCNDPQLVCLLVERIKSTMAHLINLLHPQNLSCNREWASALDGSLKELQSNTKISFLSIKTTKQAVSMSARSLSLGSFGSASMVDTQTPPSSIAATPPGGLDTFNSDTSIGNEWNGTSYRPSFEPAWKMPTPLYDQSQGIDIFNSTSPSSDNTWGQNMSPPFPISPNEKTIDKSKFSTSLTSDTSYGNSHGTLTSPHPIPDRQVLGTSLDILSETRDKGYPHVPLAWIFILFFKTCSTHIRFKQTPLTFLPKEEKPLLGFWQRQYKIAISSSRTGRPRKGCGTVSLC